MTYISLDYETHDPTLKDKGKVKARGTSCVFGLGRVIVAGFYDGTRKWSIDGEGGDYVRSLLLSPDVTIIGANIQYDAVWAVTSLKLDPKDVRCHYIDVSVAESLIDEYQKYDLDSLAWKYLRERKGKSVLEDICAAKGLKGDFRGHLAELWDDGYKQEIRDYVMSDADQPWRIWEQQKRIIESEGLMKAFQMNMDMLRVTVFMKVRGVRFDLDRWRANCRTAGDAYARLRDEYEGKYGQVNINSSKQLAVQMDRFDVPYKCKLTFKGWKPEGRKFTKDDLFEGDELTRQKKTLREIFNGVTLEKGKIVLYVPKRYASRTWEQAAAMGYEVLCNPCVNKAMFTELSETHPIVADLAQYKQAKNIVDKFLGPAFGRFIVAHYADGTAGPAFGDDGAFLGEGAAEYRIHSTYNVVGARQTGRMSSSQCNNQQIPSKTVLFAKTDHELDLARLCRECFVAAPRHALVKQDYAAQENRLAAYFAPGPNGERIRQMYRDNPFLDEHSYVTEVSGLAEQYGAKAGRKFAKNLRFGVSYGMQIARMMIQFGWDKEFAEDLYDKVASAAPWLFELMDKVQETVLRRRYITTLAGRRVHMRRGHDKDAYKYMNYLIQGSAADMTKTATNAVYDGMLAEYDEHGSSPDEIVLSVHDEDDFDVDCTDVERAVSRIMEIRRSMEDTSGCDLPIVSCPEIGTSWADGIEWDPSLGDCEDFVRRACTAIRDGRFGELREQVKAWQHREEDDGMSFSEFCAQVDEDEAEEDDAIIF